MAEIVLFKIKSNEVQTDIYFKAFIKIYCHSYMFIIAKQPKYLL